MLCNSTGRGEAPARIGLHAAVAAPLPLKTGRSAVPPVSALSCRAGASRDSNGAGRGSFCGPGRASGRLRCLPETGGTQQVRHRPLDREGPCCAPHAAATSVPAQIRERTSLRVLRFPERSGTRGSRLGEAVPEASGRPLATRPDAWNWERPTRASFFETGLSRSGRSTADEPCFSAVRRVRPIP